MSFSLFPIAHAATQIEEWTRIKTLIINPFIAFLVVLGLVYFFYGVVKFLASPENSAEKESGKKHLLWGLVGLAIMISVGGLINVAYNTLQSIAG